MKVLWISPTPGLLSIELGGSSYGGGGWVSALQSIISDSKNDIELAIVFLSSQKYSRILRDNTYYYPIYRQPKTPLQKISNYNSIYSKETDYSASVLLAIEDFKPDVIHLFGLENRLATILGKTDIPILVHLQGLLAPYDNAFWPAGINKSTFLWPPTIREWIKKNGFIFKKNNIHCRGIKESQLFKKVHYCMGRTDWDYKVSRVMSPESKYFKVNEALRPVFYQNAGTWKRHTGKIIITSTISETIYKGLDLVLKTAKLLKQETDINFEWRIIGIKSKSSIVNFFEKHLSINSKSVSVKYCGINTEAEIVKNFKDSTVYVHPSYIDNSPNSICEAQMIGIPVIACNVGGVSSLLDSGKAGILIPANAPYELLYHITEFANNDRYCEKERKYGIELSMKRHDKDSILSELINAYKEVKKI